MLCSYEGVKKSNKTRWPELSDGRQKVRPKDAQLASVCMNCHNKSVGSREKLERPNSLKFID